MPCRASNRNTKLSYQSLEERRVLTASFAFDTVTNLLTIDSFDDVNSDLTIDQSSASINGGANEDAYIFTLGAGTFVNGGGIATSDFQISGDTLTVATDIFGANGGLDANVSIDGAVGADFVELTPVVDIDFNSLQVSNFQNEGNGIVIGVDGDVTLDNLSVVDSSTEFGVPNISITTSGSINVVGTLAAVENVSSGGIALQSSGAITMTDGALIDSTSGISLFATNSITLGGLRNSGTGGPGSPGQITVTSNFGEIVDGGDTDTDIVGDFVVIEAATGVGSGNALEIQMASIEVDNTTTGNIELLQESAGGDISVRRLSNEAAVGNVTLATQDGAITVVTRTSGSGVESVGGTVTLGAEGAGNGVILNNTIITAGGDALLFSPGNVVLNSPVTLGTGDFAVDSGSDIFVGSVQAQEVLLNAQDDVLDTDFEDDQLVAAETLNIVARNTNDDGDADGVRVDTAVDQLIVNAINGGGVFINELDDINLTSINSTGTLIVDAEGSIQVESVSVITANEVNNVTLIASGQIAIEQLLAAGSRVDLLAQNDVLSTDPAQPIAADFLSVRAFNVNADSLDGIVISTDVRSLDAVLGPNGADNTGVVSITEANSVVATTVINRTGEIEISANGNLIAESLFSMGSSADDAIRLTANGIGGDVVTGRVATFQRLGGIVITASDDIRPATERPDVINLLLANRLELTAGNNQQDLFNGILAPQAQVRSLTANVTSAEEAGIFITNQGFLNVQSLTVQSGTIALTNVNGDLRVENASIQNATPDGLIALSTEGEGSDLRVGNIFARGSEGVFLNSADDIFDTSFLDEIFIDADFLGATSNNNVEDDDNGVFVSTNASAVSLVTPNGGSSFVANRS